VPRGQRDGSLRPYSRFSRQEPLLFHQVAPQFGNTVSGRYKIESVTQTREFSNAVSRTLNFIESRDFYWIQEYESKQTVNHLRGTIIKGMVRYTR
jgi:hypothetical protein